jgi:hypothetical protein
VNGQSSVNIATADTASKKENITMEQLKIDAVGCGARAAVAISIAAGFAQQAFAAPGDLIGIPIVAGSVQQATDPRIAGDADGNTVVVWTDGGGNIVARRYTKDGSPRDDQFLIAAAHPIGSGHVASPQVAVNASGQFTVVWADIAKPRQWGIGLGRVGIGWQSYPTTLHAKTFQSDGSPVSGDIQVASMPDSSNVIPSASVAMDNNGDFAVSWNSDRRTVELAVSMSGIYTESAAIYARVYSAVGKPKTSALTVDSGKLKSTLHSLTGHWVDMTSVGMDGSGNFTVAWGSRDYADGQSNSYVVNGRSYSGKGAADGAAFTISNTGGIPAIAMAMNQSGQYTVAWNSDLSSPLSARSYQADNVPVSDVIAVAADLDTTFGTSGPAVAIDASGDFIIAGNVSVGNANDKIVRLFAPGGAPLSSSVLLPQNDNFYFSGVSVAMDSAGNAVAAYSNDPPDSTDPGQVLLQRIAGQ